MRAVLLVALSCAALVASSLPLTAQDHQHPADGDVGRVAFAASCGAALQPSVERAVAMLHSFWYDEAEAAFAAIAAADPDCAIAHWGVAMSLFRPLWQPPTPAELARGAAAASRATAARHTSPRERAYAGAIAVFYADAAATPHRARMLAYEEAMGRLHAAFPEDDEGAAFYALALLGGAAVSPTDALQTRQKQAAALLDGVAAAHPQHPGIAHYFIHAYDSPALARLALNAARAYAQIAPGVPHALHMPSHIFTRLGLWDEAIASNLASAQAARDHAAKTAMHGVWDQELHALDYLIYGYLQNGDDEQAAAAVARVAAVTHAEPPALAAAYTLAAAPARYALERHDWPAAAALTLTAVPIPWESYRWAEANVYFAAGLGAARSGDAAGARAQAATLERLHAEIAGKDKYAPLVEAQRLAVSAAIAEAAGDLDQAARLFTAAADLEESIEKHPVTPGAVLPARELLGDLLLAAGKPAEALRAYEATLAHSPRRFNSVAGAMTAADRAGMRDRAVAYARELVALAAGHGATRPALAAAKALAGGH